MDRKRMKRALWVLLAAVLVLSVLTSCMGIFTDGKKPVSTTDGVLKKALDGLSDLADRFSPCRSVSAIRYDDPAIGVSLFAVTDLVREGDRFTLTYAFDRLSPIGSSEMISRSDPAVLSGSPEELRAEIEALHLWGMDAAGVLLLTLDFPEAAFSSLSLDGGVLSASVRDDAIVSVVGSDLGGATALFLSLRFSDEAFSSLSLSYLLGEASVSVTVTFFEDGKDV